MPVALFSSRPATCCLLRVFIISSALLLNPAAFAQGPGHSGGTGGSSSPHTPSPGTHPNSLPSPGMVPPVPQPDASKFISGKVSIDGGAPLTDAAIIQSICRGERHNEAYTDRTGRFSFEFGKQRIVNSSDVDDSSTSSIANGGAPVFGTTMPTSSAPGNALSSDCELRAVLPGFTSSVVQLARYQNDQVVDVGTIELHRIANVEGFTVSATTAAAPTQARKAYDKAREDESKGRLEEAEKKLEKAVSLYPNFAVAWVELGRLQTQSNQLDTARDSFNRAIAADAKLITPYQHLARLAFQQQRWEELVNVTERQLQLNPISFPEAWFNNAVGNLYLNRFEAAEKSARESLRTDVNRRVPQAEYLLAVILVQKKDFTGAAEHFRRYLTDSPNAADAAKVKAQLADAERLSAGNK